MKGFQTVVAVSGSGRRRHVATEDFHHQRECAVASARLFARWPQFRAALWILAVAMSMLSRRSRASPRTGILGTRNIRDSQASPESYCERNLSADRE